VWAKDALCSKGSHMYKIWVLVQRSHTSEQDLAMYCVFRNDTPLFSEYTPFSSPGGLFLGLHATICWLTPGHEVLIFFQDASFPASFSSSTSPFLAPLTHAIDEYLTLSPLHSITGFWASQTWAWDGKHAWWEQLVEEEFHASLALGPTTPPSHACMFLEWATDWVLLGCDYYRCHHWAVADPLMDGLHPFVLGVLECRSH
jgi:hypothetical protein